MIKAWLIVFLGREWKGMLWFYSHIAKQNQQDLASQVQRSIIRFYLIAFPNIIWHSWTFSPCWIIPFSSLSSWISHPPISLATSQYSVRSSPCTCLHAEGIKGSILPFLLFICTNSSLSDRIPSIGPFTLDNSQSYFSSPNSVAFWRSIIWHLH